MSANAPSYTTPNGVFYIAGGRDANCTLSACPIQQSVYGYRPSLGASAALISLYAVCMTIHIAFGRRNKTWFFTSAMVLGCIDEAVGYSGRILLWQNPWGHSGFILQIGFSHLLETDPKTPLIIIVLITIGPVFFSAAIYVTLYQIIKFISPESSRIQPRLFYWIFIPCDFLSLILQAVGGAISSSTDGDAQNGVNIALSGLAFQVATLTVFVLLTVDYFFRSRTVWTRSSLPREFKIFVSALALATLLILARCCYRIYELNQGYQRGSKALRDEPLFIGLESVMIIIAAYALIIVHHGLASKPKEPLVPVTGGDNTVETSALP